MITFFGVASFFAWLTFAPLQSDQLEKFEGRDRRKAGENFAVINDYFLVSFLGYAVAAGCDYLSQIPGGMSYLGPLSIAIDVGVFAGITGLFWAMMYVRMIVKAEKTWCDVNPPGFFYTLVFFASTVFLVYNALQYSIASSLPLDRLLWFCDMFVIAWGGWRVIRYHDELQLKERSKRRGLIGLSALILTPILLGNIIIPLLHVLSNIVLPSFRIYHP